MNIVLPLADPERVTLLIVRLRLRGTTLANRMCDYISSNAAAGWNTGVVQEWERLLDQGWYD